MLGPRANLVRRRSAHAAVSATTAAVVGLGLLASGEATAGSKTACPAPPGSLSPKAKGIKRFTMLLRVNKDTNVPDYANADESTGGFRRQLRDRDVFVINTRFDGSTPDEWVAIAKRLRRKFPCNRIIALNGLGADPAQPGYAFALADKPALWGLSLDYESDDWSEARELVPLMPPFTDAFRTSLGRISKRLALLGGASADGIGAPGRRTGVVPAYFGSWDYGLIARTADRRNAERRPGRRGFQVVQSQDTCLDGAAGGFHALAGRLLRQYRPKPIVRKKKVHGKLFKWRVKVTPRGLVNNLAMEVSFSNTPDPADPRTVASLTPGAASKCTRSALKRGVPAFLYWAHPDSIRALLHTRLICAIRPPC